MNNEVLRCISERRAIRKYKPEQIKEEELSAILSAGTYAPSAGNRQGVFFLVSQSQEINEILGRINKQCFYSHYKPVGLLHPPNLPISKDQPSIVDDATIPSAFYGAPTVVTIFGLKDFIYNVSDCSVAAENIMLAAHSSGIGSCYISRADETFASDYGKALLKEWHIDEKYEPICHVILGYRDGEPPKDKPRKDNRIKRIS
jgi:nitroreductase